MRLACELLGVNAGLDRPPETFPVVQPFSRNPIQRIASRIPRMYILGCNGRVMSGGESDEQTVTTEDASRDF